ncbi:unnamed protein product [Symbiodinium microadriaticum]|nr:unnamed protein product [Symbiodinium microadriaticum]
MEVQLLIDALNLTDEVPWDTSNPGSATNYTSEYDATRRRDINIQKTGKTNLKDIGQYVVANNQTTQYVCVEPMDSQNESQYTEGEEFPWCEPFQLEWNKSTAYDKGYVLVFATDYANRIQGTDGNMFGAPADSEKMLMYINDIYRTAYSIYQKDTTDWHGIRLRRYGVQNKDSENSTMNPTEGWQYYNFAPSGMQNVTQVATLPLFISKPHFLDGDPSLAGSVKGLSPTREIHDTYIDIEPNTGALCRVHNRVQVNYQVNNYNLPEASAELVIAVEELCSGLADNNATCAELDDMTRCLAMPSDWRLHNDRVYIPYAWIHQYNEGSNDDATAIKDGLYVLDNFADDIQFWCYVSAGFLGLFITGMYTAKYIFNYEKAEEEHVPFHPSEALD